MRWKTTVALLILTVGVGAYVSLYELRQPTREEQQQLSKQVLDVAPESVTLLVLDMPQAKVTLSHHDTSWTILPSGWRADAELLDQMLNHLNPLTAERILTGSPQRPLNPKTYGFDPAIATVRLTANGTSYTLLLGEGTPVQHNRYLKFAERPEIYVVSDDLLNDANTPPEKYRDPQLMRFDAYMIDQCAATTPTATFHLARADQGWRLTQPFTDQAESSQVTDLLNHLSGLTIQRFVNDNPAVEQLSTWGFDHPLLEMSLLRRGESRPTTIFFGKPLPDDASLLYAKRSDEPSLYAVKVKDVEPLIRDPHGLREKACFHLFPSNVTKLQIVRGQDIWMIERAEPPGLAHAAPTEPSWKEAGSVTALDAITVDTLLRTLADLRLSGFVDDAPSDVARYGLHPPAATISIWTQGQPNPQRLFVGGTLESSTSRYGLVDGRSAVVRLPETVTALLAKRPEQFRATTSSTSSAAQPSPTSPQPTASAAQTAPHQ